MKLTESNIRSLQVSQPSLKSFINHVKYPDYERTTLSESILHIGVGSFHRAHQAMYIDDLIKLHGIKNWAICGVGIMPQDRVLNNALRAQDYLYTLVERSDKKSNARIIGSLKSHLFGYENPEAVFKKMADPAIKIITLTATEAGYYIHQGTGELNLKNDAIQNDLHFPEKPQTIFGYLFEALDRRRKAVIDPFTVLSCDNLHRNGEVVKKTLLTFCNERNQNLAQWIEKYVSFPNCMVDRITSATTDVEREFVRTTYHIEDDVPVIAESFKQWIIEDRFSNDRPPLEKVGVQFTSDVAPYEKMKICLLNATHSAMGYLGYLCGYRYIHEIAKVQEFKSYLKNLMDIEITPLIGNVTGVNLNQYKKILMERFANETIKDHTLRICMNGSAKIPTFILPSIVEQLELGGPIGRLTLCVASWLRFLNGTDEQGYDIPIVDAQAERLIAIIKKSKTDPRPILQLTDIFGDLGHNERFVQELETLLISLYLKGSLLTLRSCI